MIDETVQFFEQVMLLVSNVIGLIAETANRIDSVTFEDTLFTQYLGYAKYAMGSGLYTLFTTVILIALGVTVWTYLLKGIWYIKNILPW